MSSGTCESSLAPAGTVDSGNEPLVPPPPVDGSDGNDVEGDEGSFWSVVEESTGVAVAGEPETCASAPGTPRARRLGFTYAAAATPVPAATAPFRNCRLVD